MSVSPRGSMREHPNAMFESIMPVVPRGVLNHFGDGHDAFVVKMAEDQPHMCIKLASIFMLPA